MADTGRKKTPNGETRSERARRIFTAAAGQHRRGNLVEAVRGYTAALQLNPRYGDPYNNLGVALRQMGRREAAVACYRRALSIRPDNASALSNLGNVLRDLGEHGLAEESHNQAVQLAPRSPESIYNLGLVLRDVGRLEQAIKCFDQAIVLRDDYVDGHWDRALTLLLQGDYEKGFAEYEWRWKLPENTRRSFTQPQWDGSALEGKSILLHTEQGFGDMIQCIRYVPLVKKSFAKVIVECVPELGRLFATAEGVDKVVFREETLPPFDVQASLMDLPGILETTLKTIPNQIPYITPPALHTFKLEAGPDAPLKIGISWAGKPTHKNDRNRSCSLSHFLGLTSLAGASFYSLQKGARTKDLAENSCDALINDLSNQLGDFADTAAVIKQLDLVITVDTAVLHLAGALGVPTWGLLPFACDWRWLHDRDDSPWYPSIKLFRQSRPGDWDSVFARVLEALRSLTGEG